MSVAKNKTSVHRLIEEVWNKGNLAVVDEVISSDWVYHTPGGKDLNVRRVLNKWSV